ncbi:hypothetical protein Fmac_001678 [Flemingia macrophylla]|uniref:Uncharacterized protein n=1 Tax=Flemingia macrophylla TaxID=520843 RepID=A0ABD1NIK7_9FABA
MLKLLVGDGEKRSGVFIFRDAKGCTVLHSAAAKEQVQDYGSLPSTWLWSIMLFLR